MKTKTILLLSGIFISTLVSMWAYRIWRSAEDAALSSCIASVHTKVGQYTLSQPHLRNVSSEWRVLSDNESERLISLVSDGRSLDCSNRKDLKTPLRDSWNNPLGIAFRKETIDAKLEVSVWSKGSDGVLCTSDDIGVRYREKPPFCQH